ncbi:MAG: translocation/assembly module TamB domain-containing protein [Spirochaetaceae bacterium]|jgi:hypothetical protein|nr:translocation/assembly module TamB domain-containing protein [Spirochaetaceae bacterium]
MLLFILLVAGTAFFLRPIQLGLQERMRAVRDGLFSRAETFLGRTITYSSIGPSIFGALDIRNIRIAGNDGLPVITVADIRISYSFLLLIQGKILESLRSVRLDRPVLAFDADRDADLLKLFSDFPAENFSFLSDFSGKNSEKDFFFQKDSSKKDSSGKNSGKKTEKKIKIGFPSYVRLWIKNGDAGITSPGNRFTVEGFTVDAAAAQGEIRFHGKGVAGFTVTELLDKPFSLRLSLRLSGESAPDFQNGTATLSLRSFADESIRFQPVTINLTKTDKNLSFTKIDDKAAFDFSADYDITAERLSGFFICEGFTPKDSLAFAEQWQDINQWLSFKMSGSVSFTVNRNREVTYAAALRGGLPQDGPFKNVSFAVKAEGDQYAAVFDELALTLPNGTIRYQGRFGFDPLGPEGVFSAAEFGVSENSRISGVVNIHSEDRSIAFRGKDLVFGDRVFADFRGSILLEPERYTFSAALIPDRAVPNGLFLDGFYDPSPSPYAEMNLNLKALDGGAVTALIRPFARLPDPGGFGVLPQIAVDAGVYGATDFKRISYHAPDIRITAQDRGELFTGVLSGTDQRFQLNQGRFRWEEEDITIAGSAEFGDPRNISFAVEAAYFDKHYSLEGAVLDGREISIAGAYGVRFYLNGTEDGSYAAFLEAEDVPFPYRGRPGRISLNCSFEYASAQAWSFHAAEFEIADVFVSYSDNPLGTFLRIAGGADQDGAVFERVLIDDGRGPLRGKLTASWNYDFSSIAGNAALSDETGAEWYDLTWGLQNKSLSLSLTGSDMQIGRFIENDVNPVASGSLSFTWRSPESFSGKVDVRSFTARVSDTDVSLEGSASLDAGALKTAGLALRYGDILLDVPELEINRLTSRASASARLQMLNEGGNADVSFTAGLTFSPISTWFQMQEAVHSFEGFLFVRDARFNNVRAEEPFEFGFSRTDNVISLSGGPQNMLRFTMTENGNFYAGFSRPFPVRGTVIGTINLKDSVIDAQTQNLYIDLTALWRFVPSSVKNTLTINGGFASASVRIAGSLLDPEFFGRVHGNGVRLGVPQFLTVDVSPAPMTITLEGNEMFFGPIPAAVGLGQGEVTGNFRFDRWVPDTFNLDIRVSREQAVPVAFDIQGIIASGKASGALKLAMADRIMTASGDITADETEITLNSEELTELKQNPEPQSLPVEFAVDLTVRAGRKLEFIWPNAEWPIIQATLEMGNSVHLTSNSLTRHYAIVGDVNIRSGEIFYFERSFYIRRGKLSLNENENRFEPRLSVRAEVRDQISSGPVVIAMYVDDAPLESFTPRFESTPPLSQTEIIALLGQSLAGIPAEEGAKADPFTFIASTADILAQTQVYRLIQRGIRNFFPFLDMLSFRTQVLQNFLIVEYRRRTAVDEINTIGIGNYLDNTSVFIGKYITPDMFFQSMLSLRQSENRLAMQGLTLQSLAIETDFGIELRLPVFDIQLNVGLFHLEEQFIKDISFSLSLVRRRSSWYDMFRRL